MNTAASGGGQCPVPSAAVIVSTYRQPVYLDLCLQALGAQQGQDFEVLVADDGSGAETEAVIARHAPRFEGRLKHVWQPDEGFRKCRILNLAVLQTSADYLVFVDGDCLAPPDFVAEHLRRAQRGCFLNGALLRLTEAQTAKVLARPGPGEALSGLRQWVLSGNRRSTRYVKLLLPLALRDWLNRHTTTPVYWLGSNSSCFRDDLLAVNGFDNRFSYGFEDGDFGNRLRNNGLRPATVRYTALLLHLEHGRPYRNEAETRRNHAMMAPLQAGGRTLAVHGIAELGGPGKAAVVSGQQGQARR